MRKLILISTTVLALLTVFSFGVNCATTAPPTGEPGSGNSNYFGYWSDEPFDGESYLGVDTRDITPDRLSALHLKEETGVEVTMVDQDAPAGKAGLKEHDVIMSINGQQVESVEQLRRLIHEIPSGRIITIGVSRDGQMITLKAQLSDRTKSFGTQGKELKIEIPHIPALPDFDFDMPVSVVVVHSSMRSGLMVENLTPQLGDFLGAKNGQGVLVRSVEKGSHGEKAGFRAGDVIVRVNGDRVNDASDFTHALRSHREGPLSIGIIRDKKEQTLTLTLPERKQSGQNEETWEVPEINANLENELTQVRTQMAQIQPEITAALQRVKPEIDAETRQAIKRAQEAMEKQRQELRQQELKLKKMRVRMVHGWADI